MKEINTKALFELLAVKYAPPAWAFFGQVSNGTGFSANRFADAMAMGIWPSRGLELEGFEIKVYRADWLKELKNPKKAEDMAGYCDRWYIVAPNCEIVKPEELPPNWGLYVASGRGLKLVKKSAKLEPEPLDKLFVAALLRRASESMILKSDIKSALEYERERGRSESSYELERYKDLKKAVEEFKKKSGVRINDWEGGDIGSAVRVVLKGGVKGEMERLGYIKKSVDRFSKDIGDLISEHAEGNPVKHGGGI